MKNFLVSLILIIIFCIFSLFITINENYKYVLSIISPTQIVVDLNSNRIPENNETICANNIETFSIEPSNEFIAKYAKKFNISKTDIISLGYLANDFAQKTLENKKVTLHFSKNKNSQCQFADIKINDTFYQELLKESGFGIVNGEIGNSEKFKANLEKARKLNFVILNHHSNKYHTLDCPYGKAAHDKIIIPLKQLPKGTKPCKFCHKQYHSSKKLSSKFKQENPIDYKIPTPTLTKTDGNITIYYTDYTKKLKPDTNCNTKVCSQLIKLIDSSKESIDLAIYGYEEIPSITNALTKAKNRGIKIRFVYDENFNPLKTYYKGNSIITNLADIHKSDKTTTATQSNMLMHNKFIIFDNSIVFTGSMNISPSGLSDFDVNDIVIINSKDIANLYTKEFEQMIGGKFHKQKTKLNLPNKFILGNSSIEVYFSPQDKSSLRIIELIKNSKKYIYIPAFLITHTNIANELISAHNRGVDVRIIIDANSTSTRNTKHAQLRHSGILLKTENYAGKLHSKTIIIDDEYLITGSMNFSNSGENKNDENLLVIRNSAIAKHHRDFFLYLWTMIPNKYLKYNATAESKESIGSCSDGIDNNFNGKIDKEEPLCQ